MGGLLDGHKDQAMIRSLRPPSTVLQRCEGAGNGIISHKPSGAEIFPAGEPGERLGAWTLKGVGVPCLSPHPLPHTPLPSGCSSVPFITSFYNQLVSSKKCFLFLFLGHAV